MYVLPEKNAIVVKDLIPGKEWTVLPYHLKAFQYLAGRGVNLPSMIRQGYEFKSQFPSPYKHQVETADFLIQHPRGLVANQIGTGKTLPVLWAYDYLKSQGMAGKILILSTLSTLDIVWEREVFKSFPHLTCVVLHGSKERRLKRMQEDVDIYIMNHEGLPTLVTWHKDEDIRKVIATELQIPGLTHVVVDECALFRNMRTDRYKALEFSIRAVENLWLLSGSPMPRAPTDIWAQARLIDKSLVSKSFVRFRDQVMANLGGFKWVPKRDWEKIVYEKLKNHCIRFERKDCLDIPPVVVKERRVQMDTRQGKLYNDMKKRCIAEMRDGQITAVNEGVKLNKLLQISCGMAYVEGYGSEAIDCKNKLKELDSIIESVGKKVIIYTPYVDSCYLLESHLKKLGSAKVINSGVSKGSRSKIFDEFQYGELNFIIAHPKAMAHGINLTSASNIIWWTPIDDYEIYDQASGRITRGGQKFIQTIWHLSCSPAEDGVYRRLKNKESMQGLLMDLLKN